MTPILITPAATTEPAVVGGDPTPVTNPAYSDHGTIVPSDLPEPSAPHRSAGTLSDTGMGDLLWSLRWWAVGLIVVGLALWAASNLWQLRQERKRAALCTAWGQDAQKAP